MVSIADIEGAERLVGIAYTAAEREQMIGNLEGQIASAIARRKLRFDNSMPTASRFDPRLPNFRMPAPGLPRFSRAAVRPLPKDEADIAFASIGELAAWISAGALTSRRLTEIYLSRIDALGPRLECFATVTAKRALAEADAADALLRGVVYLGPLHGLPYGLKDLFDTRGIMSGWGAEPYRDRVPATDATIVGKLRAAGAVLLGKTTVGALAYNDIWYGGWTRNPWNLNEGSSGSSAGSASATAAGLVRLFDRHRDARVDHLAQPALRDDRTAANLRPGVAYWRHGALLVARQEWGRSAASSKTPRSCSPRSTARTAPTAFPSTRRSISTPRLTLPGLKLGYLPEAFGEGATEVDHAALAASRRLGVEIVEVSLPPLPYQALMNVVYAEAAAAFEDLTLCDLDDTLKWQDDGAWPNTFRKARFLSAVDHVQLDRLRYQVMLALDELFSKVDAVIGPFMTGPMLIASNFTGHPCLHLRAGFLHLATRGAASLGSGKLTTGEPEAAGRAFMVPQGISLWGRLFEEGPILNLGMALEKELGVAAVRPEFPA